MSLHRAVSQSDGDPVRESAAGMRAGFAQTEDGCRLRCICANERTLRWSVVTGEQCGTRRYAHRRNGLCEVPGTGGVEAAGRMQ